MQRVTVVGAGPYGLAAAAHLNDRGIPLRVFGEPMGGWRSHMPEGMYLKSSPLSSSIASPRPGHRLQDFAAIEGRAPRGLRDPVPLSEFVRYGLWFQRYAAPQLERVTVRQVDRASDGGFRVVLESGEEFRSGAVVLAVGAAEFAHMPPELTALARDGLASHTADHVDFAPFAGRHVAVVGAGQSALESAALLHEAGARATVLARTSALAFDEAPWTDWPEERPLSERLRAPNSLLGEGWPLVASCKGPAVFRHLPEDVREQVLRTVLGPHGAWWLRDRIDGAVSVRCGTSIASAAPDGAGGVRLELRGSNGSSRLLRVDHVIAGTGYRVDLGRLGVLSPDLRREVAVTVSGAPWLSTRFEASVPGLFFTGLSAAPTFGPLLRFVCGTGYATGRISAGVAKRLKRVRRG
ncbi:FAD-dependent oxidoreductase [Streptomyces actuosus]|uniref:FAD-dependent oxidoreductase n=1 Tax=Streptomyces actuosus TaxID=1885 RepID=UPI001F05D7B5|nr:FAD-dependent oxidoreductase [Streptomyces actuosus]